MYVRFQSLTIYVSFDGLDLIGHAVLQHGFARSRYDRAVRLSLYHHDLRAISVLLAWLFCSMR